MAKITISKVDLGGRLPIEIFESIAHLPGAILLDSCGHKTSDTGKNIHLAHSIISHSPVMKVQSKLGEISFTNASSQLSLRASADKFTNVFALLSELQKQLIEQMAPTPTTSMPFLVGWLGAFNYDLNTQTDAIDSAGIDEYSLPEVDIGFYANSLIYNHHEQAYFWVSIEDEQVNWLSVLEQPPRPYDTFHLSSAWVANLSAHEYALKIQRIKQYLTEGDCYQVNFAQRFCARYEGSEFDAYKQLRAHNEAPFSAYLKLESSVIMCVSPERFLLVKDGAVETKPIKGTIARHQDRKTDQRLANELLASEKDRAENLMIVDLLRNDLSKHCKAFSVDVPKLFSLESYPAVHHLVSTVKGKLRDTSTPFDLLGGAFPGGSITGCPKVRAMQIISELEPNKRSIYCGSVGYIGIRDDMDLNICIRTLLVEEGNLYCWAGGGIVIDSDAAKEYQETQDKVAKILPVLEKTSKEK